jgi:hypothetical protein
MSWQIELYYCCKGRNYDDKVEIKVCHWKQLYQISDDLTIKFKKDVTRQLNENNLLISGI